jgi:hypothetical protein
MDINEFKQERRDFDRRYESSSYQLSGLSARGSSFGIFIATVSVMLAGLVGFGVYLPGRGTGSAGITSMLLAPAHVRFQSHGVESPLWQR